MRSSVRGLVAAAVAVGGLLLSAPAAAVPGEMMQQGRLFDANGKAITGSVQIKLSIYGTQAGGLTLW